MAQKTIAVSKEYILKLMEMNIQTISPSVQGVYISGTASFQMLSSSTTSYASGNATTSYVIPDLTQTITGTFNVSDNSPVIELKKIPMEEAMRLVHTYIRKHPGARTSDLIIELELDPDTVLEALSQLKKEQKIEGKDIIRE